VVTHHERSTPYAPRCLLPNPWGSAGSLRVVGKPGDLRAVFAATVLGATVDRRLVLDGRRLVGGDRSQRRVGDDAYTTASIAGGGAADRAPAALGVGGGVGARERPDRTSTRRLCPPCKLAVPAGMVADRERFHRPAVGVARCRACGTSAHDRIPHARGELTVETSVRGATCEVRSSHQPRTAHVAPRTASGKS